MNNQRARSSAFYSGPTRYGGSSAVAKRKEAARRVFFAAPAQANQPSTSNATIDTIAPSKPSLFKERLLQTYTINDEDIIRREPVIPQLTSHAKRILSWIEENDCVPQDDNLKISSRNVRRKFRFNPMSHRAPVPAKKLPELPMLTNVPKLRIEPEPKRESPVDNLQYEPPTVNSKRFDSCQYIGPRGEETIPISSSPKNTFSPPKDLAPPPQIAEPALIAQPIHPNSPTRTPTPPPASPPREKTPEPPKQSIEFSQPADSPKSEIKLTEKSTPFVNMGMNNDSLPVSNSQPLFMAPTPRSITKPVSVVTTTPVPTTIAPSLVPATPPSLPPTTTPAPVPTPVLGQTSTLPSTPTSPSKRFDSCQYIGPRGEETIPIPISSSTKNAFSPPIDLAPPPQIAQPFQPPLIAKTLQIAQPALIAQPVQPSSPTPTPPPASSIQPELPASPPKEKTPEPPKQSIEFSQPADSPKSEFKLTEKSISFVDMEMEIDSSPVPNSQPLFMAPTPGPITTPAPAVTTTPVPTIAPSLVPAMPSSLMPSTTPAPALVSTSVLGQASTLPSTPTLPSAPVLSQTPTIVPPAIPNFTIPNFSSLPSVQVPSMNNSLSMPNGSNPFQPSPNTRGRKILRPARRLHR